MNKGLFLLLFIVFSSCSSVYKLNSDIDINQKNSIIHSPFRSSKSMTSELKMQFKFRKKYLSDLQELRSKYPRKITILTEDYWDICFGCQAENVTFFNDEILVSYSRISSSKNYTKKLELKSETDFDFEGNGNSDIKEILELAQSGSNWNSKPSEFGTEACDDGGHTFYTVIYPNGKMESMYMRCWIEKEWRGK